MAPRPASARSSAAPAAAVRVGDQQQRAGRRGRAGRRPRSVRDGTAASTGRTCASGTSTAVSVVGGSQPARSAAATHGLGRRALEQVAGDPLQQPLPHPAGGGELVGVAGDAGRGELVDVGEDQLREVDQRLGRDPAAHGGRRHLAPGDPRADPVRRQQRLGAAPAAGLAAAELVGALDGRGGRRTRVGAAAAAGQGEEAAERELHGVADVLAHRAGQRALVAGHLGDDRRDRLLGDRGQARAHLGDGVGGQLQPVTGGATGGAAGHLRSPILFAANKCDLRLHARRTGLYALRCRTVECMSTVVLPRRRRDVRHTAGARRSLRDGLRRVAEAAVTPLELDDVLDVFHPLRAGADLRGRIVVRPPRDRRLRHPRDQARQGLGRPRARPVRPRRRRRRRRPPVAHLLADPRPAPRPLHQHHRQGDPRRRGLQPPRPPGPARPDGPARPGRGRLRARRPDARQAAAGHRRLRHHPGDRDAAQPVLARRAGRRPTSCCCTRRCRAPR